jgi:redox-sensing transcriptional repressor
VAVPANEAQRVTDALVASGIKAILSYAPIRLHVPETVQVRYIDPVITLQEMTYYLDS